MKRDPRTYLWEARDAADHIRSFLLNRIFEEYLNDVMLRLAVERQFEIIGEALNQLSKTEPTLPARLPDSPRAISFSNRLIHGCMDTDDRVVWSSTHDDLPLSQLIAGQADLAKFVDEDYRTPFL